MPNLCGILNFFCPEDQFYTVGAGIYAAKKPDPWPRTFGFHEIFHVFVVLGSMSHFWMTYRYVSEADQQSGNNLYRVVEPGER